jgi:DNA polymerase III subunit delta'
VRERAEAAEEEAAERSGPAARKRAREAEELARRASRRARNDSLDLGLALLGAWLRDLAAAGDDAVDLVLNADRRAELEATAGTVDPRRARRAAELVMDTRRRLQVNVSETLALEALAFRLEFLLTS